jgi:hypothetical protein
MAIERFLAATNQPQFIEPGEAPISLGADNHALEWRSGYLTLQVWTETRNFSRRITRVAGESRGRLDLEIERFGKRTGTASLVEANAAAGLTRRTARLTYRESFRRSLLRQFPGWPLSELTTEPDLEHSLSPAYPRALIRSGSSAWAAIGAGPESDVDGVLTFGIIWLSYLRARERRLTVEGLAVFLPSGRERTTCLRMRHLNPRAAQYAAFTHSEDGFEDRVDLADYGNLDTRLEHCSRPSPDRDEAVDQWAAALARLDTVERIERSDGAVSLRVRGLEFARGSKSRLMFGLETRRRATASNVGEIAALAAGIARFRDAESCDRSSPLFTRNPEGWLESQVRGQLREIDATLMASPVYGQVPAFTAGDRGVIDLLAVDSTGRLAVVELKASEDIHLPLQALDYWMRVRWHSERGEFGSHGYFPGVQLRRDSPRMLLVAPALDFHPANEVVLRYLDAGIEWARIGIGLEWRKQVKVMFRHGTGH